MEKIIWAEELGLSDYLETWKYQKQLFQKLIDKKRNPSQVRFSPFKEPLGYLLLTEHLHVYTLGKSGKDSHLLLSPDLLKRIGANFYRIDRGGDITYHGLGQLVVYPILDLEHFFIDIHKYLRSLEEVVIRLLAAYGLQGERSPGETGVWLDVGKPSARKLCAIGIRVSRWVSMHGLALNVNTDMSYFKYIIPCGIQGKGVSSMQWELDYVPYMHEIIQKFKTIFQEVFQASCLPKPSSDDFIK
ncbi:lipoyl(octanoyl) transferase LipB [Bacteroidetes bacterium endosymbiont of Geopemphigus sp.]|uniref:lipoyl(octanoyl) transferase LipB n=1 Tax=Bacteroidetes bacterium endosymbiont of Geopemphigus sp. TaxID=2047937 RepID=UPI000CD31282|nr:lipoyl(octanoyl) transferase LipB [Bacteroidetes bacterium endosymbiont of Geopemphigus sp.]